MTRRKGEMDERQILHRWPHHLVLPAEAVRGAGNSMTIHTAAKELSAAPRPCHLRRGDGELIVFCFAKSEDAQAFAERFGGGAADQRRLNERA